MKIFKNQKYYEDFNSKKLLKSIKNSGLSATQAKDVLHEVISKQDQLKTTNLVYRSTYKAIRRRSKSCAANYNIKKAIFALGPSGYAFELLVSELLKTKGYKTKVSVIKHGEFVDHEVDVVATRADGNLFCECKFHNNSHIKNDIKLPLYIHSRFLDIKGRQGCLNYQYAIFSNTKFSKDALRYANGVHIEMYSMNYPVKDTFIDLIKNYKIYPVTVLKSLSRQQQMLLIASKKVTIKQLTKETLLLVGVPPSVADLCMKEVKLLLANCT